MSVAPLDRIMVTSRDFGEYLMMFGLDEQTILTLDILDCPGGASDFAARLRERSGRVVSVDPLYGSSPDQVATTVSEDLNRGLARAVEALELYDFSWTDGLHRYVERRQRAAQRFLADFTEDRARGGHGYVDAALPNLPFPDSAFDLALVPNLLFTYADLFDRRWHLDAVRELMRVSAEVRIHPLAESTGMPYSELDLLRSELAEYGIRTEVLSSEYRLHRRDDRTMACRWRESR